jgi:hypothetical protein
MQIIIKGEMTLAEIRQTLYEKLHEMEDDYAIVYSQGATLYVNPTNGMGDQVVPRKRDGTIVAKIISNGPYRSAADDFKI